MKRLERSGASLVSPELDEDQLRSVLDRLGVGDRLDSASVGGIYGRLAAIIGSWFDEQETKDTTPLAKALLFIGRTLPEISRLLSGHETGLHSSPEIHVTNEVIRLLAIDPTIGSRDSADALVSEFQQQSARLGHVCMVAYVDLTRKGDKDGRAPQLWYDEFTRVLLEIAQKAGVNPALGKDRKTKARTGWLVEAAMALEPFLHKWMRSPSPEACGKRLERAKKRLSRTSTKAPRDLPTYVDVTR